MKKNGTQFIRVQDGKKKLPSLLTRKGIDNYCPLNKVKKQWADRKKTVEEPLFTSYVFVYLRKEEHLQLMQTDGVINIVYWLGRPAVIPEAEIDVIRRFLGEYKFVKLEKTTVNLNDTVRIVSGPLMDHGGKIASMTKRSVKVLLPSQGYALVAEVDIQNVEVVAANYAFNAASSYQYAV